MATSRLCSLRKRRTPCPAGHLFRRHGPEIDTLRLVDFLEPEAFARRMDQLLNTDLREE